MQTFTARVAATPEDTRDIFRLRYDVYIAEQGKAYGADHAERLLRDEADDWAGCSIIVRDAGGLAAATVRCTYLSDPRAFAHFCDLFDLHQFASWRREQLVVCSRLAASAAHRHTAAAGQAFEAIYRHELGRGVRLCFQYCAPHLLRLFKRYGFREFLPPVETPVLGTARRMLLVMDDLNHLRTARSPFLPIALETIDMIEPRNRQPERFPPAPLLGEGARDV